MGRFTPYILEENDYEMIFVANFCRPLTQTPEEALEVMREIEAAGGIGFTAIVNNTNLGRETTPEVIYNSAEKAKRLSELSEIPVLFTSAEDRIAAELDIPDVFPMKLQKRYYDF